MASEELLMNPLFVKQIKDKPIKKIDYKFYKRRIYSITKDLLGKQKADLPESVKKTFFEYANSCVEYFEFIDTSDILQNEYTNINNNTIDISDDEDASIEEINRKLINVKMKKNKIEDFIDVGLTKQEPVKFPEKKKIDIKNEVHKKKGLKKNITN